MGGYCSHPVSKEEGPAKPKSGGVELMDRRKRPEGASSLNKTIGGSDCNSDTGPAEPDGCRVGGESSGTTFSSFRLRLRVRERNRPAKVGSEARWQLLSRWALIIEINVALVSGPFESEPVSCNAKVISRRSSLVLPVSEPVNAMPPASRCCLR